MKQKAKSNTTKGGRQRRLEKGRDARVVSIFSHTCNAWFRFSLFKKTNPLTLRIGKSVSHKQRANMMLNKKVVANKLNIRPSKRKPRSCQLGKKWKGTFNRKLGRPIRGA
jgi:hypothetical protein